MPYFSLFHNYTPYCTVYNTYIYIQNHYMNMYVCICIRMYMYVRTYKCTHVHNTSQGSRRQGMTIQNSFRQCCSLLLMIWCDYLLSSLFNQTLFRFVYYDPPFLMSIKWKMVANKVKQGLVDKTSECH